jgi:hypothetical protein
VCPNDLRCADFKDEFNLRNGRYCYPLSVTDHASRFLLAMRGPANLRGNRLHRFPTAVCRAPAPDGPLRQ